MGGTTQHIAPYVRALTDRTLRVEEHDHRLGPCDLPPYEVWWRMLQAKGWRAALRYRCRWSIDWMRTSCGCRMCTGHWYRRENRRRSRHDGRLAIRRGEW